MVHQQKTAILTDTGSSIHPNALEINGIFVLPLQIMDESHQYLDMIDIQTSDIYHKLNEGIELKTSMPSYQDILNIFDRIIQGGYKDVICIPLTLGISSTGNYIQQIAKEKEIPLTMIDVYTTCQIQKEFVYETQRLLDDGYDAAQIKALLEPKIQTSCSMVLAKNITHLKKSGRLTPLAASAANLLKIIPLLVMNPETKGKIDVYDKIRTEKKAKKVLVDTIASSKNDKKFMILHSDDIEGALDLKKLLLDKGVLAQQITIHELNSVIAVHVGMKCLAIQCLSL